MMGAPLPLRRICLNCHHREPVSVAGGPPLYAHCHGMPPTTQQNEAGDFRTVAPVVGDFMWCTVFTYRWPVRLALGAAVVATIAAAIWAAHLTGLIVFAATGAP